LTQQCKIASLAATQDVSMEMLQALVAVIWPFYNFANDVVIAAGGKSPILF
jgi:hypothetical protein